MLIMAESLARRAVRPRAVNLGPHVPPNRAEGNWRRMRAARDAWSEPSRMGARPCPMITVRGVPLFVEVVGHGEPLLLMHGGPGADHWSLQPFRRLADRFTLVFYDHRCNGRSDRRAGDVDDLGEPDRRRRRAARGARLRALGGARPLLRRPRRPRVRAALSRRPVAPRPARHRRRRALVAGERADDAPGRAATTRRPCGWPGASSPAGSPPARCTIGLDAASAARTTTFADPPCGG